MAKKQYCYDYPRPAVTVDLAAFRFNRGRIQVLLIRREHDPFAGRLALPGGFVEIDEPFEIAARRELREETGLVVVGPVAFLGVYGDPGRDPRGRTISIVYTAPVRGGAGVSGSDDASEASWIDVEAHEPLAFDHDRILDNALSKLREDVKLGPAGIALLPRSFTRDDAFALLAALFGPGRRVTAWLKRVEALDLTRKDRPR